MPRERPNFFIVGAAKSGTTSLHAYLQEHPEAFLPDLKEPHHFSGVTPHPALGRRAVTDPEEYRALFRGAGDAKAVGEASTSYLWHPHAAERIRKRAPHARIIILLRDPIERAHSHWLMDHRQGIQDRPFLEAVDADLAREPRRWGDAHLYVDLGLYHGQVARYLDAFGPEQVLVLPFDHLTRDAAATVARVADFLDIDAEAARRVRTDVRHNPHQAPRNGLAKRVLATPAIRKAVQRLVPKAVRQRAGDALLLKKAEKPPLPREAVERLKPLFAPDVDALEARTGRAFPELRRTW